MRGSSSARQQASEPRAPLGERTLAQILRAIDQQIVGAQMRGKFRQQLRRDGLAVEPLLQHVEGLHAALAHHQQLAVDRAVEAAGLRPGRESSPKCPRRCANRAGARAGRPRRCRRRPARGCRPISIRPGSRADRARRDRPPRSHGRAWPAGTAPDRGSRACRRGLRARRTARHRAAAGPARSARSPAGPCRPARPPRSWRAAPRRRRAAPR